MSSPIDPPAGLAPQDFRRVLRQRAIAAREALPAPAHRLASAAIHDGLESLLIRLNPRVLGFCWPYRAEVDVRAWVGRWLAADPARVAVLPVVQGPQAPLAFARWCPGAAMRDDAYGIAVPQVLEWVQPELVLVPLNAFDPQGFRIGYGGGYFDRTLASLDPPPQTVGVGFELGRVESIHPEPHDRALDWIVTEAGVFAAAGCDAPDWRGRSTVNGP